MGLGSILVSLGLVAFVGYLTAHTGDGMMAKILAGFSGVGAFGYTVEAGFDDVAILAWCVTVVLAAIGVFKDGVRKAA